MRPTMAECKVLLRALLPAASMRMVHEGGTRLYRAELDGFDIAVEPTPHRCLREALRSQFGSVLQLGANPDMTSCRKRYLRSVLTAQRRCAW